VNYRLGKTQLRRHNCCRLESPIKWRRVHHVKNQLPIPDAPRQLLRLLTPQISQRQVAMTIQNPTHIVFILAVASHSN